MVEDQCILLTGQQSWKEDGGGLGRWRRPWGCPRCGAASTGLVARKHPLMTGSIERARARLGHIVQVDRPLRGKPEEFANAGSSRCSGDQLEIAVSTGSARAGTEGAGHGARCGVHRLKAVPAKQEILGQRPDHTPADRRRR